MKYVYGDVTEYPVFCQQVNCKGVMGSGLAKQIREKYHKVYYEYKQLCEKEKNLLGHIQIVVAKCGIGQPLCVNLFAQDGYGRDKQYTDYKAFKCCLLVLSQKMKDYGGKYDTIAFPYKIGCGLGGGDWNIVEKMIEEFSKTVSQEVVIVKKE